MPRAAYERFGNHPWERRSRQSFRGGETGARRCAERSPGSPGGEMADLLHGLGGQLTAATHRGDAATVTPDVGRTTVQVVLVG